MLDEVVLWCKCGGSVGEVNYVTGFRSNYDSIFHKKMVKNSKFILAIALTENFLLRGISIL